MTTSNKLTKKELNQVFWRSFGMEWDWNYERQMNMSYCYSMLPVIKKLYPNKVIIGEDILLSVDPIYYAVAQWIIDLVRYLTVK